jgi:hypothetical protein
VGTLANNAQCGAVAEKLDLEGFQLVSQYGKRCNQNILTLGRVEPSGANYQPFPAMDRLWSYIRLWIP